MCPQSCFQSGFLVCLASSCCLLVGGVFQATQSSPQCPHDEQQASRRASDPRGSVKEATASFITKPWKAYLIISTMLLWLPRSALCNGRRDPWGHKNQEAGIMRVILGAGHHCWRQGKFSLGCSVLNIKYLPSRIKMGWTGESRTYGLCFRIDMCWKSLAQRWPLKTWQWIRSPRKNKKNMKDWTANIWGWIEKGEAAEEEEDWEKSSKELEGKPR